jgi:gliding motility-associated-like protein
MRAFKLLSFIYFINVIFLHSQSKISKNLTDSLKGFNESEVRKEMLRLNIDPEDQRGFLEIEKKKFIINKYNLKFKEESFSPPSYKFGTTYSVMAPPCVNEGFELGSIVGWTASVGQNTNSCNYPNTPTLTSLANSQHLALFTTPFLDPVAGLIPNSPFPGNRVLRINDGNVNQGEIVKIRQTFNVTASNFLYEFAYLMIAQNATNHNCCNVPVMYVRVRDCIGNLLACPNFSILAPTSTTNTCSGIGPASWTNTPGNTHFYNLGWQKYSIDLTSYIGSCVTIEVMVGDCALWGHAGYAYFDSNCTDFGFVLNGTTSFPAPNYTVNVTAPCGSTANISAPGGLNPYLWNGPPLSGIVNATTQAINTSVPGIYTIQMTPPGICNPIYRFINLTFTPNLIVSASPPTICSSGTSTTSTLSASGATSYTWNPGNIISPSIVVSPTTTTIYTVSAVSGTCSGSQTIQVTVQSSPTIAVSSNTAVVCSGGTVQLTASGASSYTWNPGGLTGGTVVVTPTSTTTYTVIGSNGVCNNTNTITINVIPGPTITAFANPTAICSGNSANLFASGASTYTWFPGGMTGAFVTVNPTVTTTYTVIGSVLSCSSSATVQLLVNNGPTLSISANPTTVCSASPSNVTLTATGGSSYTWNPGSLTGSQVVVNPTSTTVYTVTSSNTLGCTSNTTFTYIVTPTPTISVSPVNPTICAGQGLTLTATGASSYTWNPGGLTGSQVVVSPTTTTAYTITGANGSCTVSIVNTVVVNPAPTLSPGALPNPVCSGNNVTLTVIGTATGYTWNPGGLTGTQVVVGPTVTTQYTVTGVNTAGCFSSAVVNVTVNPTPTLVVNPASATICAGQSVTFTASGAAGYTWNPGNLSGSTVVVSPTATTVYTVVGAIGSCTSSVTRTVFVVPPTTLSISATSTNICNGQSTTLTATGATSYTWNPGSLTGSQVVVSPTITTNYTLIGANGSCSNSAVITVSVRPKPNINVAANPTVICSGQSATLGAIAFPGGAGYTWTPGGQNSQTIVVSPSVTTQYTITAINIVGCTNSSVITVSVNPTPTLIATSIPTLLCSGNSATLTASGATNYTWFPGSLSGSTVIVSPTTSINYTLVGANGNCTSSAVVNLSVVPTPVISATVTPNNVCAGNNLTITPAGASNYTLIPGPQSGTLFVVNPTISTIYTITGTNSNGCTGTATVVATVLSAPLFTMSSNPPGICIGESATISVSGGAGNNYTWQPGGLTATQIVVNPTTTTVYSLQVQASNGCTANGFYTLNVTPVPTIVLNTNPNPPKICSGQNVTLTATGATNYTWMPGSLTASQIIVSPTAQTTYTLTGNNGGCNTTATVVVDVSPGPQNVSASATGTISCNNLSVGLQASTTSTNVSYTWSGPGGFTSSVQNPSPITVGGNYTLTITDNDSGCPFTTVVTVVSNTSVPNFTAFSSGNLGCVGEITLTASSSSSLTSYVWNGPSGFTTSASSFTVNVPGNYTVVASDPISGCTSSSVLSVMSDTNLPVVGATITPATCNGTLSNNDGSIILFGHSLGYKYDYVVGPTYTGSATYATATLIPFGGVIVNNLPNPSSPQPYTVRIFNTNGCYKDTTLILLPINCNNQLFGLTKAASTPSLVNNEYVVNFTITAINNGSVNLNNITLTENLLNCFVSPSSFTVIQTPVITSTTTPSGLTANSSFDGIGNTNLVVASSSTLFANRRDTIIFSVRIKPNGYFGPFTNTVIGFATHEIDGTVFSDISNNGFNWDQNGNGTPTDDNQPTVINFTPNVILGVTKSATLSPMQPDKTYFIYYTVRAHNLGNDTLKNLSLVDTLQGKTVKLPATYMIPNPPVITTGTNATADAAFNGSTVPTLLIPSLSVLPPSSVIAVDFTVKVTPDTVKFYRNYAIGLANGAWLGGVVKDLSNNGTNPDLNGNGNPYENSDNVPTDIYIPSSDIFVPEVFTPNGDGKNDFFVIKGLNDRKVRVIIFNRWGNKVYENSAYDNSWDGTPNVQNLTFGNGKVPAGVYYYIIEFLDHDNEKFTGYVVVQY